MAAVGVHSGNLSGRAAVDAQLSYGAGVMTPGLVDGAPRFCSYARDVLDEIGGFEPDLTTGVEVVANRQLTRRGYLAYRDPDAIVDLRPSDLPRGELISRGLRRGTAEGRFDLIARRIRGGLFSRELVRSRLAGIPASLKRGSSVPWDRAIVEVASELGFWLELLRPTRGKAHVLFGRPAGMLLLAMLRNGRPWSIAIINFDLVAGTLHGTLVPGGTPVSTAGGGSATIADALDLGHAELGRFQIDDIIGRGFGLSIDDYLLIDGTLTPAAADVRVGGRTLIDMAATAATG